MNFLRRSMRSNPTHNIRCMIVTGSEKAFAAGADIKEMAGKNFSEAYREDFVTRNWEAVARARKPVIAAVAGYALGGGCELAMMCDFIIAADNAKFGQPEINLGSGSRRRRDTETDPGRRQSQSDGNVPDGANDGRSRSRARRACRARCAARESYAGSQSDCSEDRRAGPAGAADDQGMRQCRVRNAR